MKVLLVEDDAGIGRLVVKALESEGLGVDWQRVGRRALDALREGGFALIVLDLMLPDVDGVLLARQIRLAGHDIPILMLTARAGLEDKLEGFRSGADDFLAKPFHVEELLARVRVLLRRSIPARASAPVLAYESLNVDAIAREATVNGAALALTKREFEVLECLTRNAQRALSREALIAQAWGDASDVTPNAVDVYVGYLRRKMAAMPGAPQIVTLRGIGYRLSRPA
ncbi:hypothetical protein CCR94_21315 [Rhodoblastus sphagnicola]|uniref:DNA-binding response regulator n=1 Tax=Rhodoblastus sphagnicola TaxID=333368 RepID=A0A2S6MX74_9HYPH|nr:response regulator transcription factor [Rhodoblastus sphagnicola]MBB4199297.1 DNA-binding response OmpR family regulator [Rhodoblastus sphagnicola]PPQ26965.1 hypothetical protein CCR94_21315 [Rhodoblastus sphagnicola]